MTIKTDMLPTASISVERNNIQLTLCYNGETKVGRVYVMGDHAVVIQGESLTDIVEWAEGIIEKCEKMDADLSPNMAAGLPF